jgi:hypothetical protein
MNFPTTRHAAAIFADINKIKNPIKGTLTQSMRTLTNGSERPHYHLQRSVKGKNITTYVPPENAARIREGIGQQRRLDALVEELAQHGLNTVLGRKELRATKRAKGEKPHE